MSVDKNDFDEEMELAAIREARKHDDPVMPILLGVLVLVIGLLLGLLS